MRTTIPKLVDTVDMTFEYHPILARIIWHPTVTLIPKCSPNSWLKTLHQQESPSVHRKTRYNPIVARSLSLVRKASSYLIECPFELIVQVIQLRMVKPIAINAIRFPLAISGNSLGYEVAEQNLNMGHVFQICLREAFIPDIERDRIGRFRIARHSRGRKPASQVFELYVLGFFAHVGYYTEWKPRKVTHAKYRDTPGLLLVCNQGHQAFGLYA